MSENKKNIPLIPIIISITCLVLGFISGIFYQKSKTPSFFKNGQFQVNSSNKVNGSGSQKNIQRGQNGGRQMSIFNQTTGEITKIDSSSITIKTTDGGSKIILISDSTSVRQSSTVTKDDLKVGTKIAVIGEQNTDGSVTGKNIEINPTFPATPIDSNSQPSSQN